MAKQSETMAGLLSTLKSNFDQVLSSFGSPILKGLEPTVSDIGNALTSRRIYNFAGSVGKGIVTAFQDIGNFAKNDVMPAIQSFASYLQSPSFQSFAKTIGGDIGNALNTIGTIVKTDIVPAVNAFINVLKSPQFQQFAESIGRLAGTSLAGLKSAFDLIKPIIEGLFSFVQNVALPALSGLANGLNAVIGWFEKGGPIVQLCGRRPDRRGRCYWAHGNSQLHWNVTRALCWPHHVGGRARCGSLGTLATALPYLIVGAVIAGVVVGILEAIQALGRYIEMANRCLARRCHVLYWSLAWWIMGVFGAIGGWFHDRFMDAYNAIKGVIGNFRDQRLRNGVRI